MAIGDLIAVTSTDGTTEVFNVDSSGNLATSGSVTATSIVSTGAVSGTSVTASTSLSVGTTVNQTSGASTAAAGSTFADAGALPSGTASVYPTTAADGTKGVKVSATDKVTGRMIFIGNGVSNQILKVYGPSGASINGAAADAAFSSASGKGVIMYCLSSAGNTWLAW